MIENLINEALGEFPKQYALALEIADKAINMVKTHDRRGVFDSFSESIFKKFEINIEYSEDDFVGNMLIDVRPTKGSFNGADFDNVSINYFISRMDVLKQNYDALRQKLYEIAVHELNHGYVLVAQAKYNLNSKIPDKPLVNDLPEWYEPLTKFIAEYNCDNDISMRFARALYACHEKEMKAIISETTPHIERELGDRKDYTRNDFIRVLKNCEPYKRYYNAFYEVLPEARKHKKEIKNKFEKWGIEFGEWMFDFIGRKSVVALKYVEKNAMLYFHRFIKCGNTDWFKKH